MNASILFLAWLMSAGTPAPTGSSATAVTAPAAATRIKLDVSARDGLKDAIRQYIATELQTRGPVQFVDNGADWTLDIVTTELTDPNGATVAVGLSFIIERHGIHTKMMLALAQACRYFIATGLLKDAPLDRDMRLLLQDVESLPAPDRLAVVSRHKMCVITPDRLPQACRDMVAAFDTERLGATTTAYAEPAAAPVGGK